MLHALLTARSCSFVSRMWRGRSPPDCIHVLLQCYQNRNQEAQTPKERPPTLPTHGPYSRQVQGPDSSLILWYSPCIQVLLYWCGQQAVLVLKNLLNWKIIRLAFFFSFRYVVLFLRALESANIYLSIITHIYIFVVR
jgi:hypothetical protein